MAWGNERYGRGRYGTMYVVTVVSSSDIAADMAVRMVKMVRTPWMLWTLWMLSDSSPPYRLQLVFFRRSI